MTNIDHGVKHYLGFNEVQFQGLYCLTFSYVACFIFWKTLTLPTVLMILPDITRKNIEFAVNNLEHSSPEA